MNDAHDIDLVMPMYNLIEYSDNYSKTSAILWQYYRDESALGASNAITDIKADNATTDSFKIKQNITGETGKSDTENGEAMAPLKYLSNFWSTIEMPSVNCNNWYENLCFSCNFTNPR